MPSWPRQPGTNLVTTRPIDDPAEDAPAWFASVAVLDEGGYHVVLRDSTRREHEVTTDTDTDISRIAYDLIIWLAARNFPGRPTQHTSTF